MSRRDGAELMLLAALWGASFLFMRLGAAEFGPLALVFLRAYLLTPAFWAVFLAGLRAAGLAIWNPLRVLRAFWHAFWGAQWAGLVVLLLIGLLLLIREAVRPTGIEIPFEPLVVLVLAINLAALIIGAASGASRFE